MELISLGSIKLNPKLYVRSSSVSYHRRNPFHFPLLISVVRVVVEATVKPFPLPPPLPWLDEQILSLCHRKGTNSSAQPIYPKPPKPPDPDQPYLFSPAILESPVGSSHLRLRAFLSNRKIDPASGGDSGSSPACSSEKATRWYILKTRYMCVGNVDRIKENVIVGFWPNNIFKVFQSNPLPVGPTSYGVNPNPMGLWWLRDECKSKTIIVMVAITGKYMAIKVALSHAVDEDIRIYSVRSDSLQLIRAINDGSFATKIH